MCFSAEASFTASGVLLVAGIASLKKVSHPHQILFASIPLVFAVQQFSEGMLWLGLKSPDLAHLQIPFTYLFLVFAQVIWPMLVPISLFFLEKSKIRKRILLIISFLGIGVSAYLTYCLCSYPVNSIISCNYIRYELGFPKSLQPFFSVIYIVATIGSPFVSRIKWMWLIGLLNLAALIVTKLWFDQNLVSVWCFFAAILSASIWVILRNINRNPE